MYGNYSKNILISIDGRVTDSSVGSDSFSSSLFNEICSTLYTQTKKDKRLNIGSVLLFTLSGNAICISDNSFTDIIG
jgi:hypothetical protein